MAEALRQSLAQPLAVGPGQLAVSASMGIAGCRGDMDAAELMRRADLALYRAKALGRGRIEPYLSGLSTLARQRMRCIVDSTGPSSATARGRRACALMADAGRLSQRLHALRALGVHLALDDFGTGYSSLGALKGLPFNRLKIAQEFVFNIADARADLAIVRTTLALAEAFNLEVVAEGIETPSQRACLLSMGCAVGQGDWFARPQSGEEVARLMLGAQSLLPDETSAPGGPSPA